LTLRVDEGVDGAEAVLDSILKKRLKAEGC
jgi:hypothetical protein